MKTILVNLCIPFLFLSLCYTVCYAQTESCFLDVERSAFDPCNASNSIPQVNNKVNNDPIVDLNPAAVECDCKTDFFTVNDFGEIKKWTVVNNTVTGGNVVLTGGHRGGLAFCGSENSRTFYCANYPSGDYRYYDTISNVWITKTTPFPYALNNGGYKQHQYYMGGTTSLHYYNGYSFKTLPLPSPFSMAVADIAVDTLGRAWYFSGGILGNNKLLYVFDSTGVVATYNYVGSTSGFYGSFFLDGTLYIAKGIEQQIVPLILSGNNAIEGTPIPFPNNVYTDAASCQCLNPPPPPPCPDLTPVAYLLPNTITGNSPIEFAVKVTEVNNAPTDGTPITVRIPSDSRLIFVWNIGLTQAAFIPVQNADWNYLGDNGLFHTMTYNGPGLIIPGGTSSAFGFQAFYDPQSTAGYTSISATIVPFSGGECTLTNNVDAEKLVYFD